ncbi:unnamed protein product [Camellia sinensis]
MGMSAFYGPPKPEEDMIKLIHHSINSGVTFLDTSAVYGPHTNEILLGKAPKGGMRDKVELASKFGIIYTDEKAEIRGDPGYVRAACESSLKRLDMDCIDLYYQHRIDTRVPIEITIRRRREEEELEGEEEEGLEGAQQMGLAAEATEAGAARGGAATAEQLLRRSELLDDRQMGELKKLVEEGKIKYIGLSEASPSTIRRAHAVHPITAIQLEWSLWTRDVEEEIVPTCRELGIGIVAYSPLGRGFLSSGPKVVENLANEDSRKHLPRFQPENMEHNKNMFERVNEIAEKKGCTPGQLALAWVHHQGSDVCPIPGTTKIANLDQNIGALLVKLTPEEMSELESIASADEVKGDRYMEGLTTWKNSDTPPLSSWTS